MSSFQCACGHIIRDQTSHLPYKGEIIKNQACEEFYEHSVKQIKEFIHALLAGNRDEWVNDFYQYSPEDDKIPDNEVIFDILNRASFKNNLGIYQCESCGRIFIETEPRSFQYLSFTPEANEWQNILAVTQ